MGDRRVLGMLGVVYAVVLVVLVTGPWGWELNRLTVRLYVFFRTDVPFTPAWALPEHYGALLNVVLFVPAGAFLVVATGRPWWWVTLLAAAGSTFIELLQWLFLTREGGWVDVVANTLGALLGAAAVSWWRRLRRPPAAR